MATGTLTQTNFTSGEVSPELLGRSDLSKYANGVALLRNFIPKKHGGVVNRTGTRFVAAAKHSGTALPNVQCCAAIGDSGVVDEDDPIVSQTVKVRLIPFQFSVTQTYVIEFGHQYVRFYRDDGQVESGGSPYEIASPYDGDMLDEIKFTQSADVLYLCHPEVSPQELRRNADDDWEFVRFDFRDGPYGPINTDSTKLMTVAPGIVGPATLTASGAGWGAEGPFKPEHVQTATNRGLLWRLNLVGLDYGWGYVTGFVSSFVVNVEIVDEVFAAGPPPVPSQNWRLGDWNAFDGYPWVPAFHRGRLWFGGRNGLPQTLWASGTDSFLNFRPNNPTDQVVSDADAIRVTIDDDQVNAIRWFVSTAKGLLVGSSGAEFVVQSSDVTSGITPTNIEVERQSNRGSKADVRPVQVGNAALFAQRHGRKLREMVFQFEADQHVSNDLTLISEHITADRIRWLAYMAEPQPIVWVVDDAGGLLSMTYDREQEVIAWARHTIGGDDVLIESAAVIPEDDFDRLWLVVKRTVDGNVVRYIEYLVDPFETGDNVREHAIFLDSSLTYDGWNTEVCEQLILEVDDPGSSDQSQSSESSSSSSGDNWAEGEEGWLTALCTAQFSPSSVDRVYRFNATPDEDEVTPIDVRVIEYHGPWIVKVLFLNPIPDSLRETSTRHWALTASVIGGLDHLEGQTVGVLVDGATHPNVVVSGGNADLTLGSQATEFETFAAIAHVGLPYESELETLPLVAEFGFDSRGRQKSLYKAHMRFHQAVGARVGTKAGSLSETLDAVPFRDGDAVQGQHVRLFTGTKTLAVDGRHDTDIRLRVKQVDPLPITLLSISYEIDVNAV